MPVASSSAREEFSAVSDTSLLNTIGNTAQSASTAVSNAFSGIFSGGLSGSGFSGGGPGGGDAPSSAPSTDRFGNPLTIRSPRQASHTFGLDQPRFTTDVGLMAAVPKAKFAFFARFVRSDTRGTVNQWNPGLGFSVKTMERPAVTMETQELIEYNKKRQVYTGLKYQPLTITFHDTVDNKLLRMWSDYSSWYFGDFNQNNQASWSYDTTSLNFRDTGLGFGFAPMMDRSPGSGLNTSFFFDRLEIFQFYGKTYTQYDLVNPKITSFTPDELDYEQSAGSTIRLTLAYEAIIYHNAFKPQAIGGNPMLHTLFSAAYWDGGTFDPPGTVQNLPPLQDQLNSSANDVNPSRLASPFDSNAGITTNISALDSISNIFSPASQSGGALSSFGNFNFGSIAGTVANTALSRIASGNFSNLGGALLSSIGGGNIANALSSQNPLRSLASTVLGSIPGPIGGISATLFDLASGRVGVGTSALSGQSKPGIGQSFAQGIAAAALSTAISGRTSTSNIVTRDPSGMRLTPAGYGTVNASRSGTSAIGVITPAFTGGGSNTPGGLRVGGQDMIPDPPLAPTDPAFTDPERA